MNDKWAEYRAGTLVPPAFVQYNDVNGEHLIWVWTGENIVGPMSRRGFLDGTVVAEWITADSTDWQSNAVSYVRTDYRRLLLRVSCRRSSGNDYFYREPLSTGSKANAPAGLSYMG